MAMMEQASLLVDDLEASVRKGVHQQLKTRFRGYVGLAALIFAWITQAETSQWLQTKMKFNKPFFIVCFNHGFSALLLPATIFYFQRSEITNLAQWKYVLQRRCNMEFGLMLRIAMVIAAFYAIADYLWYIAIVNISVAAGTTIFNTSPLFVYLFSLCFLHEKLCFRKFSCLVLCFFGVALVAGFQNGHFSMEGASFGACVLVLGSAMLYAMYEVAFKMLIGQDNSDIPTVCILTGFSGLFTFPVWVVGASLLSMIQVPMLHETIALPSTASELLLLVYSALMALGFNILLPLCIMLTSPIETSVTCMLTIPLTALLDMFVNHAQFPIECIIGSICVMTGFIMLEYLRQKTE